MKKVIFSLVALICMALVFTPLYAKTTLKLATFLPKMSSTCDPTFGLIEDIQKKAKGELEIRYVGGPEAIPGFKQFEAVRTGVLDMILGCESYYGRQVTGAAYTHLTRLDAAQERANGYYDFRVELLKKQNVFYLGRAQVGPWFHVFTNKKISRPQDIKGQKIRVSATYEAFVNKLGAATVTLPGSDIYTALERGTIDGYAWCVLENVKMGWNEVCKYILEPRIYAQNLETLVNLKTWQKLPPHLQKIMMDAMIENEIKFTKTQLALAEMEYKEMQEKGMTVIKFSPEDTKWYVESAYEAGWAEVFKENPELAPKLKKFLSP